MNTVLALYNCPGWISNSVQRCWQGFKWGHIYVLYYLTPIKGKIIIAGDAISKKEIASGNYTEKKKNRKPVIKV